MGTYGDRYAPDGTTSLAESAAETVHLMLDAANNDTTGRLWHMLSGSLPMLAEAAPEVLLDAIDEDLSRPNPILVSLFQDRAEQQFLLGPPRRTPPCCGDSRLLPGTRTTSWTR